MSAKLIKLLKHLEEADDSYKFVNGDCHYLAKAIQAHFGGVILAIIRHEYDEDNELFSSTYSHMVVEINGKCFDIDGEDADSKWESKWSAEPDEDGLVSEFEYIRVNKENVKDFVVKNNGIYNESTFFGVSNKVKQQLRELVYQPKLSGPSL